VISCCVLRISTSHTRSASSPAATSRSRCAASSPRNFVIDSDHTIVRGEGEVNLRTEGLGLRLVAEPKDGSLFALRGPIRIDGTLAQPAVHPQLAGAALRAGVAAALATIAPPLAIIPFLQAGKKQNVDCEPLILDASRFIRNAPPPPQLHARGGSKRQPPSLPRQAAKR
jgi:hypothetical protein